MRGKDSSVKAQCFNLHEAVHPILGLEQQSLAGVFTMLRCCYGNIKPMNGPPPRDREVSKCEIDSVVHRNMLKLNLSG